MLKIFRLPYTSAACHRLGGVVIKASDFNYNQVQVASSIPGRVSAGLVLGRVTVCGGVNHLGM